MGDVAARVVDVGLQQDGISRSLVELDVVALGQHALELCAVESAVPHTSVMRVGSRQNSSSWKLRRATAQFDFGIEIVGKAALAIRLRHHLVGPKNTEILGDQRVLGYRLADGQCDLDRVVHQAVSLQLHLPAGDVQAGDQLLVRAS